MSGTEGRHEDEAAAQPGPELPIWRWAAIAGGIVAAVVLTGMVWFWVIDSQARALQRGEPAPFASPAPNVSEWIPQSARASDDPRPIP